MADSIRPIPLHRFADMREQLDDELFFSDGVLTQEQERRFDAIQGGAHKVIARCGLLILEAIATAGVIENEEQSLAERRRARVRREVDRRKEYVKLQMQRLGIRKVETALVTVTLHGNSTLSIDSATPTTGGPQKDLFARSSHQRRGERGHHVRVR